MLRSTARFGVALLAAVVSFGVAVAGVLAWRLWRGPVPLDFLVPQVEAGLARAAGTLAVRVGGLVLVWDGATHHLELRARDVRLGTGGEAQGLSIPAMAVRVRPWPLLRGEVAVRRVDLVAPALRLARRTDGQIELASDGSPGITLPAPGSGGAAATPTQLPRIGIRDGDLVLVDQATRETWRASHVDLDLDRRRQAIVGRLAARVGRDAEAPRAVAATALLDPRTGTLAVRELAIHLGDSVARGRALVRRHGDGREIRAKAALADFPLDALPREWPEAAAREARRWVIGNVSGGRLRTVRARVRAFADASGAPRIDRITAAVAYDGLAVRYVDTMPVATAVGGTGRYDGRTARFAVTRGTVQDLDVTRGDVRLVLGPGRPTIAIEATVRGALADALAILACQPIGLTQPLGRAPRDFGGTMEASVTVGLPLGGAVAARHVQIGARGTVRDAAADGIAGAWSVAGGALDVALDGNRLAVDGTARVRDVPVRLHLDDRLDSPGSRRLDLTARLDERGRAALGLDTGRWLTGPVEASVHAAETAPDAMAIDVDVDLTPAALTVPALALAKAPGAAGRAEARLDVKAGGVRAIANARLTAGATTISGEATRGGGAGRWRTIDAEARLAPGAGTAHGGHVTLAVRPAAARSRVSIRSDDAGLLFRSLGHADARGGQLTFDATADLAAPGFAIDGRIHVTSFTLTRSPLLARLVTLTSLSGLAQTLERDGIAFDRLDGGIATRGTQVTLTRLSATGPALALSVDGTIDRVREVLALRGALVPSYYGLNTAAARIPLLGKVITGAGGKGVQVFAFHVDGTVGDPRVTLDPVASIAPGMLRDIVEALPRPSRR